MGMVSEFKEFALKGNMLDLAVGVIIGAAFGGIITSLIGDVIMPVVGYITGGGVDFSQHKIVLQHGVPELKDAAGKVATPAVAEIAVNWGKFITVFINFLILALCIFIVVKAFNTARKKF